MDCIIEQLPVAQSLDDLRRQISFRQCRCDASGLEKRKLSETKRPSERKGSMFPTSSEILREAGQWPLQGDPFDR